MRVKKHIEVNSKFTWQRKQKYQDNAIGSTVFHEARKPVNFESPSKISLLFINHLFII